MKINIVLPFDRTAEMLYIWANEEKSIDFRKDTIKAERCTLSFAATELISYLKKTGFEVSYSSDKDLSAFNILLALDKALNDDNSYFLEPIENGVKIISANRTGILYGSYELLKMQGIRWLNPNYDVVPDLPLNELTVPDKKTEYHSDMPLGRGFDFEGQLKDSTKLWLWMARNGLNISTYRPYTHAFQRKLGMTFKMGGHIFERILNPDRRTESGKTLWEEHNDWYGIGKPDRCKETALHTQFCMSNKSLLEFLGKELLNCINTEWYEADRIDVWTFDTWGSTCQCENCKKLGNSTDQTLYFLSYVREYLNNARKTGALDHDVDLIMCSYEGTATISSPEKEIPKNLLNGKDYVVYYPILRCYKHTFADEECSINSFYREHLEKWKDIPITLGEYYNVSKFEDLPILFTKTMPKDIKYYHTLGIRGMTYMHLPMIEWGMRNLTQVLYAELCKNVDADVEKIISQYMKDRYKNQSADAAKAYDLCEKAYEYSSSWRAWGTKCILSRLQSWNGEKPKKPFDEEVHLKGHAIESGEKSVEYLNDALKIMQACKRERLNEFVLNSLSDSNRAVNPIELNLQQKDAVTTHIDEDIRSLIYGRDVMKLTVLFLKYYEALYKDLETENIWEEIDALANDMSSHYMPIRYINSMDNIELCCDDFLERSQLRSLYHRCLRYRLTNR